MVDMPFYPKFYDHNLTYNIPIYSNISISIYVYIYIYIYIHTWLVDTRLPNWVPGVQSLVPHVVAKLFSILALSSDIVLSPLRLKSSGPWGATWGARVAGNGWDVARVAIVMGVPQWLDCFLMENPIYKWRCHRGVHALVTAGINQHRSSTLKITHFI